MTWALEEVDIYCPYCGEHSTVLIDPSVEEQNYIEDCQICCAPIVFDIHVNPENHDLQINLRQENE